MEAFKRLWSCRSSKKEPGSSKRDSLQNSNLRHGPPSETRSTRQDERCGGVADFSLQDPTLSMSTSAEEDLVAITNWRKNAGSSPTLHQPYEPQRTSSRVSPHFTSYRKQIEESFCQQQHQAKQQSWNDSVSHSAESSEKHSVKEKKKQQQHRKSKEYIKALKQCGASHIDHHQTKTVDEWGQKPNDHSFLSSVDSSLLLSNEDRIFNFPVESTACGPLLRRSSSRAMSETSSIISRPDTDDGDSQPERPRSSSRSRSGSSRSSSKHVHPVIHQDDYDAPGAHRRPNATISSKHRHRTSSSSSARKHQQTKSLTSEEQQPRRSSSLSRLHPSRRDSPSVRSGGSRSRSTERSAAKQQYETACRLLKSAILEKNLDDAERDFLTNILKETKPTTQSPTPAKKLEKTQSAELSSPNILSGFPFCKPSAAIQNTSTTSYSDVEYNFQVLGCEMVRPVLTPLIMEALQGFMTDAAGANFWLKYSTSRDPISMPDLLESVRSTKQTVFCIETTDGDVFGAVVSTKWRIRSRWYGSNQSFLWRLKNLRSAVYNTHDDETNTEDDNELEIYPNTNVDTMVQYCTEKAMAFGGSTDWSRLRDGCPYGPDEPQGIGLLIDGDLMGGESNSCVTFANPSLCRGSHHEVNNEFDVKTLEVWTTTPCSSVPEAERFELGVSPEDSSVVEHSKNIFSCVPR